MIIGDTTTFGGRGISPQLVVTAPAGSSIDVMQNSVVLQTYTLTGSETSHTFYVDRGTYTVRGTLSTQTKSETVNVSSVGIFSVEIRYPTYIYYEGDEYSEITGGWGFYAGHGTKQASYIQATSVDNQYSCQAVTASTINLTNYTKIGFDLESTATSVYIRAGSASGRNLNPCMVDYATISTGRNIVYIPIVSHSSLYIGLDCCYTATVNIYKVWLE